MKKFNNHIITLFLLTAFLVSNLGIAFSSPCCENENKRKQNTQESNCCKDEVIVEPESNCCESETPPDHICQNNCDGLCFTTYTYIKLNVDQIVFTNHKIQKDLQNNYIFPDLNIKTLNSDISLKNFNKAPPQKWGKSLIISLHQHKIPTTLSASN